MARNVRAYAVAGAVALGLTGAVVAPPAHAAPYPACNRTKKVTFLEEILFPANAAATPWTNCVLRQNDRDHPEHRDFAVLALLSSLRECYPELQTVAPGFWSNDGTYDIDTEKAVKYVQDKEHVKVDGVYGPVTAHAMKHLMPKHLMPKQLMPKQLMPKQLPIEVGGEVSPDPSRYCRLMKDDDLSGDLSGSELGELPPTR